MQLIHPFLVVLDVQFQASKSPFFDPGHREAVPVPGLPDWTIQAHQAEPGWLNFTVSSPELRGEDGLTELVVLLDFLNAFGPADPTLSSITVYVLPESVSSFQLETLSTVIEAYRPVLSGFHGSEIGTRHVMYAHDFQRVGLVHLPLLPEVAITFGAVLFGVSLLGYGLKTEQPDLPTPATARHVALKHLTNVLGMDGEVRAELLPALKRQVVQASVARGEISLNRARKL